MIHGVVNVYHRLNPTVLNYIFTRIICVFPESCFNCVGIACNLCNFTVIASPAELIIVVATINILPL